VNTLRFSFLAAATAVFALLGALVLPGAHPARADGPVQITVEVNDDGFKPDTIEIDQGALVELTFVWAQTIHTADTHIMVSPQLKFESDMISAKNLKSTVKFVATNAGTFTFKCDIECEAHSALQHGTIKVKAGGGGAAALQPSKISIEPSGIFVQGKMVTLAAFLLDADGQPIPKAEVSFYEEEEFIGQKGLVEIGKGKTGPTGQAKIVYFPRRQTAEKLVVRFEAAGVYDASEQTIELPGSEVFGPPAWEAEVTLHGIRAWAPVALIGIIGGVWALFAFILFQAWSVRSVPGDGQ